MRKFLIGLLVFLLIPAAYVGAVTYSHADLNALPALESGDLIFQTALDRQLALPIMVSTGSIYTHVGIIHKRKEGYTVVHATGPVMESSLAGFIKGGWGERFTIVRYPGLSHSQREALVKDAQFYLGRPYNGVFYMKDTSRLYCSELPYLAFQTEHLPLGNLQHIGELYVNNGVVHKLFNARWHGHPACQTPQMTASACWDTVMKEPIITPAGIARDPKLTPVYTNYLF